MTFNLQATLCPTIAAVANFGILFEGINWGVAWTLPNRSSVEYITNHKNRRRERRQLYNKIELVMNE